MSALFRMEKMDPQGVPWAVVCETGTGPSSKEGCGEMPTLLVPTPVDLKLTLVAQVQLFRANGRQGAVHCEGDAGSGGPDPDRVEEAHHLVASHPEQTAGRPSKRAPWFFALLTTDLRRGEYHYLQSIPCLPNRSRHVASVSRELRDGGHTLSACIRQGAEDLAYGWPYAAVEQHQS